MRRHTLARLALALVAAVGAVACSPPRYGVVSVASAAPAAQSAHAALPAHTSDGRAAGSGHGTVGAGDASDGGASGVWEARRDAVRDAVRHAWRGYVGFASDFDDLTPLSRSGHDWLNARATLFDSLDTLLVTGLRREYDEAVDLALAGMIDAGVADSGVVYPTNVFEYELRVVGGLAGAYALSGDGRLLTAARVAADRVLEAQDADTLLVAKRARLVHWTRPLHWAAARVADRVRHDYEPQPCGSLATIGTLGLTFRFLSRETGDPRYAEVANAALATVSRRWAVNDGGPTSTRLLALGYSTQFVNGAPQPCSGASHGLGSGVDSFYEGLAKEQILLMGSRRHATRLGGDEGGISGGDAALLDATEWDWPAPTARGLERVRWADLTSARDSSSIVKDLSVSKYPAQGVLRMMYAWLTEGLTTHGFDSVLPQPAAGGDGQRRGGSTTATGSGGDSSVGRDPARVAFSVSSLGDGRQSHLNCYLPGVLALGSSALPGHADDLVLAEELMRGCMQLYERRPGVNEVGLAADVSRITAHTGDDGNVRFDVAPMRGSKGSTFKLRPEAVESAFVLFRVTGKREYREFGWRVFQAIERHCRVATGGYTGLKTVAVAGPGAAAAAPGGAESAAGAAAIANGDDDMPSYFVAETLKYLYLLFSDPNVLPLDRYVFTTEAHPLTIEPRCSSAGRGGSGAAGVALNTRGVVADSGWEAACTDGVGLWSLAPWPWEPVLLVIVVVAVGGSMLRSRRLCCRAVCCVARPWTWVSLAARVRRRAAMTGGKPNPTHSRQRGGGVSGQAYPDFGHDAYAARGQGHRKGIHGL